MALRPPTSRQQTIRLLASGPLPLSLRRRLIDFLATLTMLELAALRRHRFNLIQRRNRKERKRSV